MTIFYTITFCFFCFYLLYVFKETILPIIAESRNKKAFQQNLYTKVGWIAEKEKFGICYKEPVELRNNELLLYILEEQSNLEISKDYNIDYSNETEMEYVKSILETHKNDTIKSYFHGFLPMSKNICKLNFLEYYMFSLGEFLDKQCKRNSNLFENKLYKFKSENDPYSYYELTDFGRAYYKVYLIVATFRQNNENIKKIYEHLRTDILKTIVNTLTTNEISFIHFNT